MICCVSLVDYICYALKEFLELLLLFEMAAPVIASNMC